VHHLKALEEIALEEIALEEIALELSRGSIPHECFCQAHVERGVSSERESR